MAPVAPAEVTLAVIAKAPVPGRVKTRLCPPCSPEQAASIAEAALRDTLDAVAGADVGRRVVVIDGECPGWVPHDLDVVAQRGDGLDHRLAAAFVDVGGPTVVVGMDTPQVTAELLTEVVGLLCTPGVDAVLGPSNDGGYWVIGLRCPDPAVFAGVPMSVEHTHAAQLARLDHLGLSTAAAPRLTDVDTFDEAVEVARIASGPRFRRVVDAVVARLWAASAHAREGVPEQPTSVPGRVDHGVSRSVIGNGGGGTAPAGTLRATTPTRREPVHDLSDRLDQAIPTIRRGADAADTDAKFPSESVRALADAGLLGLTLPTEVGGLGGSPADLVEAVSAVAASCGSTSMIYLMHLSAAMVTAAAPPPEGGAELLAGMAEGSTLGTLAFSEKGSRSHFWAPVSKAVVSDGGVRIAADKSWVTSASTADVYITSALAPGAEGPMETNLYAVPRIAEGVDVAGRFDGLGLRGNDSAPVRLDVEVSHGTRLGDDGGGFALMMQVVLPWFSLGNSAVSLGLAQAALDAAVAHATGSRFEHLDSSLCDLPTIRAYLAKAWTDLAAHKALLRETAAKVASPDDSTMLAVLGTKAGCNEATLRITETALRVTGGAGFSKQVGVDRPYRDARAGFVMAPTADALFDFTGRALCGIDLF